MNLYDEIKNSISKNDSSSSSSSSSKISSSSSSSLNQQYVIEMKKNIGRFGVRHRHTSKSGVVVEHIHPMSCSCNDEIDGELEVHHMHDENSLLLLSVNKQKNSEDQKEEKEESIGVTHRHRLADNTIVEHTHVLDCSCNADISNIERHHYHDMQTLMMAKKVHDPQKKDSMRRKIFQRIALRVVGVTCLILAFKFIPLPFAEWYEDFVDYSQELRDDNLLLATSMYTVFSVLFCTFVPTGYLPTVVGGLVFQIYIAIPISWIGVNAGALLNMAWVRNCGSYRCCSSNNNEDSSSPGCVERVVSRAVGKFEGLDEMLREDPTLTVFIVRFPFMYNGLLNYVFSASSVRPIPYAIGNAFGFLPGCVIFSLLGQNVKSFGKILSEGGSTEQWMIFIGILIGIIISVIAFKLQNARIQKKMKQRRVASSSSSNCFYRAAIVPKSVAKSPSVQQQRQCKTHAYGMCPKTCSNNKSTRGGNHLSEL